MAHELPPLPYAYNALEPYIDEQTVHLHHDLHQKAYVDGLNNAEKKLADARAAGDYALVKHWSRELAFHGSGAFMHEFYWANMAPAGKGGGGEPTGALAEQIKKDFGSFEAFKKQYSGGIRRSRRQRLGRAGLAAAGQANWSFSSRKSTSSLHSGASSRCSCATSGSTLTISSIRTSARLTWKPGGT